MKDLSDDELLAELGVETEQQEQRAYSITEERVIAGFDDINQYYEIHGTIPHHGEQNNIFERLYAIRLDRLSQDTKWREFLKPFDKYHLLDNLHEGSTEVRKLDDDRLLAELGVTEPVEGSIENLRHVRPHSEKKKAEEIGTRKLVKNFDEFKPLFLAIQKDLETKARTARAFVKDTGLSKAEIKQGEFFILGGLIAYIAEVGERFKGPNGEYDSRLRVIFSNGTESNMLLRSLQSALYKDEKGRRITEPEAGPLFTARPEPELLESGTIYVLRSKSKHPYIVENRNLIHKIGVTGGDIKIRIANAKLDPTFLMDDVEIVATYKLYNINRIKLEKLLHRVFHKARCDILIKDRFGHPIRPKEWFLVPLSVIDEAVERINDHTLPQYEYEPQQSRLVKK